MIKEDCNMVALRLFMGVQMFGFGLFSLLTETWHQSLSLTAQYGWLWMALIIIGGMCTLASALVDLYLGMKWVGLGKAVYRKHVNKLAQFRLLGFYLSGCVWAGWGYSTMVSADIRPLDFMAPTYVAFTFYLAFKDATRKRTKVVNRDEARQTATQSTGGAIPVRLRT
jgi:hypothetical protein